MKIDDRGADVPQVTAKYKPSVPTASLLFLRTKEFNSEVREQGAKANMRFELCPGYFSRDDQRMIDREGPASAKFYCVLCNTQVKPVFKDGGWVPKNHEAVHVDSLS